MLLSSRKFVLQVLLSLVLNWVIGPALMTGLAWATLPDLPGYRNGVILVCLLHSSYRNMVAALLHKSAAAEPFCRLSMLQDTLVAQPQLPSCSQLLRCWYMLIPCARRSRSRIFGLCAAKHCTPLPLLCSCVAGQCVGGTGALHRHGAAVEPACPRPR